MVGVGNSIFRDLDVYPASTPPTPPHTLVVTSPQTVQELTTSDITVGRARDPRVHSGRDRHLLAPDQARCLYVSATFLRTSRGLFGKGKVFKKKRSSFRWPTTSYPNCDR